MSRTPQKFARYVAAMASYQPDVEDLRGTLPAAVSLATDTAAPSVLSLQQRIMRAAVERMDPQSEQGAMLKMVGRVCYLSTKYAHPPVMFRPTTDLTRRLMATDVDALSPTDIKMPFPVFGIQLPRATLIEARWEAALVSKATVVDPSSRREFEVIAIEVVSEYARGFASVVDYCSDLRKYKAKGSGVVSDAQNAKMAFVFATLLYLQTKGATATVGGRRVGIADVVLPPLRTSGRLGGRALTSEMRRREIRIGDEARPFVGRANTMVRGHFRNQACGPQMSERRVVWIEPHFRFRDESHPVLGRDISVSSGATK